MEKELTFGSFFGFFKWMPPTGIILGTKGKDGAIAGFVYKNVKDILLSNVYRLG